MTLINEFNNFELFVAFSIMPSVFVFLWWLIAWDFKNFQSSKKAYMEFTAPDPINCYKNYIGPKISE